MNSFKRLICVYSGIIWTALLLVFGIGCASLYDNPDNNESDIPWNTPQVWEGTPALPGVTDRGI